MFKNLKGKFAKLALVVLALQLAFLGLGSGAGQALAVVSGSPAPTLMSVTANIGGVTQTVPAGQFFAAYKGQTVVPNMLATLSESDVSLVSGTTGDITIMGPLGGSVTNVIADYGTFTLVGNQAIITPNSGNAVLADIGDFTFTVAAGTIENSAGTLNAEINFGLEVTASLAPALVSVTAVLGGVSQTKLANESLTAIIGQSVGAISAIVTEDSTLVSPLTEGVVTISGETIPPLTSYGTFVVDPTNHKKLNITPNTGNAALALEGVFTFTVAAGQIQSVSGTPNAGTTFSLVVTTNSITAIGAIVGTPQVGEILTAGTLTPALATATYQWQSSLDGVNFSNISGATTKNYSVALVDIGKFLRVKAVGTTPYTGTVISNPTTVVPTAVAPSKVENPTALVNPDGTVTFSWEKPLTGSYTGYRIQRDGIAISLDLQSNQLTYTDNNVVRGQTYVYSIVTIDAKTGLTYTLSPFAGITIPSPVVAAAFSDNTTWAADYVAPETNTNTPEVKAQTTETVEGPKNDTKQGFPVWGIILLLILAAVGGYLIWSQKPAPVAAPVAKTKKNTSNKKK